MVIFLIQLVVSFGTVGILHKVAELNSISVPYWFIGLCMSCGVMFSIIKSYER
jgi:hypothetical protein